MENIEGSPGYANTPRLGQLLRTGHSMVASNYVVSGATIQADAIYHIEFDLNMYLITQKILVYSIGTAYIDVLYLHLHKLKSF